MSILFLRQSLQMLQKVSKMLRPEIIFEILQKSVKKLSKNLQSFLQL